MPKRVFPLVTLGTTTHVAVSPATNVTVGLVTEQVDLCPIVATAPKLQTSPVVLPFLNRVAVTDCDAVVTSAVSVPCTRSIVQAAATGNSVLDSVAPVKVLRGVPVNGIKI